MSKQRNEQETYTRNRGFTYRADFDGGRRVIYEGWAEANVSETTAGWQIVKHTYVSNRLTESNWAQMTNDGGVVLASDDFAHRWDQRAALTYGAV